MPIKDEYHEQKTLQRKNVPGGLRENEMGIENDYCSLRE